jgi:hypothetical protein
MLAHVKKSEIYPGDVGENCSYDHTFSFLIWNSFVGQIQPNG